MAYNGWSNYETWCVALWLDNDPGGYEMAREVTRGGTDYQAAQRLRDYVDEMRPDLGASMFADLLGAALSEVDWQEIASHYREDDDEADDDNDETVDA